MRLLVYPYHLTKYISNNDINICIKNYKDMFYPYVEKYINPYIFKIADNIIIFYTFSEIRINRYLNNIYKMSCFKLLNNYYKRNYIPEIEIIKDNKVFVVCKKSHISFNPEIMDFFIYTDIESSYPLNKLIFNDLLSFTDEYELCSYKFQMIQLLFNENEEYIITLHNSKETYYVVDNQIDKYVILYLLYKQHGVYKNPDKTHYMVNLMDDNINIDVLNENDLIILYKDNFKIQYRIKMVE